MIITIAFSTCSMKYIIFCHRCSFLSGFLHHLASKKAKLSRGKLLELLSQLSTAVAISGLVLILIWYQHPCTRLLLMEL